MTTGTAPQRTTPTTDPNESQRRAADPARSVWVGASAGAGKTKVLTDRVLRLLLPRDDGAPGTQPHRILCLTFTKAAASEMRLRLSARLSRWAVMKDEELAEEMRALLGRAATDEEHNAARRLFASVTDAPGGLNIMTIHAFCQSVLGRFPLEADLPPHFEALDDTAAAALLTRARNDVMTQARRTPESPMGRALHAVAAALAEDSFVRLTDSIISEGHQFSELLQQHGGLDGLHRTTCETLDLQPGEDEDTTLLAAGRNGIFDERGLRESCRAMAEHGTSATDHPAARAIQKWLDAQEDERAILWPSYVGAFLTQAGVPRKNISTKKPQAAFPDITHILDTEAQRVIAVEDKRKAARCAALTHALLLLGDHVRTQYIALKSMRAGLDFNDLIDKTLTLLEKRDMADWVMFKLDGGLDHILIDEAQDTNPEQWRIIAALCDDFFSGQGARENIGRTVFAVGDEKQSIYSFQRAAPEKFRAMRSFFSERIQAAKQILAQEDMNVSFRSVPAILKIVDDVFAANNVRAGLGPLPLAHESFRTGQAGCVELWPLFVTPQKEKRDAWAPPVTVRTAQGGGAQLAEHIGTTIKDWLDSDEILPARGRPVQPGDIMILVRRRSAFVGQLIRALKTRGLPVGGADRMVLREQLAVQDLIAAAQFALLPADDLSLACLLKSPFIGWDDAQLEEFAWNRKGSLWQEIQNEADSIIVDYLRKIISRARHKDRPYEFFSALLQSKCPAKCPNGTESGLYAITARMGAEALDPLEELLSTALAFEDNNIPTLQAFLLGFGQSDTQIKREQEEAGGHIRIMTVHGAKGLQAPIVILPDTARTTRAPAGDAGQRLLWPHKSGLPVPLWSPRKDSDCRLFTNTRATLDTQQDEEYRRLLYVALTRAEDRLYICGHTGRKKAIDESWYHYVARAMNALPDAVRIPFDHPSIEPSTEPGTESEQTAIRYEEPQTLPHKSAETPQVKTMSRPANNDMPDQRWLKTTAPIEARPQPDISPSRARSNAETDTSDDKKNNKGQNIQKQPTAQSPLAGGDTYRFRRGLVTHRLLEHLPDIDAGQRQKAAELFVSRHAKDLPQEIRTAIISETMAVLENPAFAPLFGPGSLAEVPLTGIVDGTTISGQIDRFLITENEIWIADFKTNRPPPADITGVSDAYRAQMKYYSDIVSKIYPKHKIRCFLLWTDGPRMMELDSGA